MTEVFVFSKKARFMVILKHNTHILHKNNLPSVIFRVTLAVLHFNENGNRQQHKSKEGTPSFTVSYPKAKKGEAAVIKSIKVPPTFSKQSL
jgi:hypothetical protein